MAINESDGREFLRRLLLSRMRLINHHPFFGLLLMHMQFVIDESAPTAYTDGNETIAFGPVFLKGLSDSELDFVMMHEIMHVTLRHCQRGSEEEPQRSNIAADIVVNSNILLENNMDIASITLKGYGESMHRVPDGSEGHLYTLEEVFEMLSPDNIKTGGKSAANNGKAKGRAQKQDGDASSNDKKSFDDHSHWSQHEEDDTWRDVWVKNIKDAGTAIEIREASTGRELMPAFAKRLLKNLRESQIDWRLILNEFIQQEVNDYSFSPPDRRFDDSPFFLPDFNEFEDKIFKVLLMIDTSGSMSDAMIAAAFSEVKGAIDQHDGKLEGWLGFFDAAIIDPVEFSSFDDVSKITPVGGGGTDFQIIFEYVAQNMSDDLPVCIVILTDGYAPFPSEKFSMGIPVLWLLNNETVNPPWGKVARIKV